MSEHVRTVIAAVRAARRRGNRMSDATRAAVVARETAKAPAPEPEPKAKSSKAAPEPPSEPAVEAEESEEPEA